MESSRHSTQLKPETVDISKAPSKPPHIASRTGLRLGLPIVPTLGLVLLSYLLGAAIMFFRLPLSGMLTKGFMGVRAWSEQHLETAESTDSTSATEAGNIDQPGKTFDGYTLYAGASQTSPSSRISLIDMQRKVVHDWSVSFNGIWPNQTQVEGRQLNDSEVCVFACHLYPNGDLLVVFHGLAKSTLGCGLAKIDKDSNLIWSYNARAHHDVTVGEDGTIYTIVQESLNTPIPSLEFIPPPWKVDHLVMLSPGGKELTEPVSILEALRNSPYSTLLSPLETALNPKEKQPLNLEVERLLLLQQDVLHANSVKVLNEAMAPKFPEFKAGQVLMSLRSLQALVVLDPAKKSIVWGAVGPWHYQHDAQFLDNGRLLLFDNLGSPRGSRILEYNLRDGSFPWSYPGVDNAPFLTKERGMAQRLPNGNTLMVISEGREMIEVTPSKEVVWTHAVPSYITTARRYGPEQLSFLKAGQLPRR